MNNAIIDDGGAITAIAIFLSIAFLVFMICVGAAIIGINSNLKDLVDLEYKKYKESKSNTNKKDNKEIAIEPVEEKQIENTL